MTKDPIFVYVDLDEPIVRGEQTISKLRIRKPGAPEMRGLSMLSLIQMDMVAVQTILPRISDPILTAADIVKMDGADLFAAATEIAGFLLNRSQREAFPQA